MKAPVDEPRGGNGEKQDYQDVEVGAVGSGHDNVIYDAVFGELDGSGPNYRNVGTMGAWVLITKADVGLGILSIPAVFQMLGIVPGIIVILVMQTLIAYCASIIGPFKRNHPEVYGLADAGYVFGGRWVKEFLYVVFGINMVMVHSSAVVSIATALNAITIHGACTAVFMIVAVIIGLLCGSFRTLSKMTWIGWAGLISLMASVITLTIAVGVTERPAAAPATGDWHKEIKVFAKADFHTAMTAVSSVLFSYGATPSYFNIVSEMRNPRKYTMAMLTSIGFLTSLYLIIGGVVYHYCGQYVASPALGSAGPLMKRVCYGLALPALIASCAIFAHIPAKHIFVRIFAGSPHLTANSFQHWIVWLMCILTTSIIGYIIASAIPNFGNIISLIGALVVPTGAIMPYQFMWWHDNYRFKTREERRSPKLLLMLLINILCFLAGMFITVAGTYSSILDIIAQSADTGPWTCADNSNSVPKQ